MKNPIMVLTGSPDSVKGVVLPDGARAFLVRTRVTGRTWAEHVGKVTPLRSRSKQLEEIGSMPPPRVNKREEFLDWDVIALNLGKPVNNVYATVQPALSWGNRHRLQMVTPWCVVSVAATYPDLNKQIGAVQLRLLSLQLYKINTQMLGFEAIWNRSGRNVCAYGDGQAHGIETWLAFGRPAVSAD